MSKFVPPTGPKKAKVVIVGEAPGADEARLGEPFVGEAGKLLNKLLSSVGLIRQQCYITNVFKERPPRNDVSHFIELGKKVVTYSNGGFEQMEGFKAEMEELDPNIIIALGNVPLYALTGERGITKWRGSILPTDLCTREVTKVIPALHPALCLRMYEARHLLNFDLRRAVQQSRSSEFPADPNDYIIRPTLDETFEFIEMCRGAKRVGADIEVARREVSCISLSPTEGNSLKPSRQAISIPFWSPSQGHLMTPPEEAEVWRALANLFQETEVIFHNAAFDFVFLYQKYGISIPRIQDTMIAQAILWPDFAGRGNMIKGKSLAFTTSIYTNMPYYKDEGKEVMLKQGKTYADDDTQFWLYNAKDAVVLPEILHAQERDLRRANNYETYQRQLKTLHPICFMSAYGMRVDLEAIKEEKKLEQENLNSLTKEIQEEAGWEVNLNSPKQLKELFFDQLGETPTLHQGRISTNEDCLKTIARRGKKGSSIASKMLEYRKLAKLIGTYYEMQFDEDSRLRSSINPVGAETGRFSSSKTIFGTGGNMQNIPKHMRKFLVPDPDHILYEVDLSQAENRLVALFANEEKMLRAFKEGIDIHSLTASLIFGGEPDKKLQDSITADLGNGTRTQRYWGKLTNHALNYDMGIGTASKQWELPMNQTKAIHTKYFQAYPALRQWHRRVEFQMRQTKTVINPYGRHRKYLTRWGKELLHQAYAYGPQSTVADHLNQHGLNELYYNQEDFGPAILLNQIHDSIIFQVPISAGWSVHATILNKLKKSLQAEIEYEGRRMSIPAEVTMYCQNLKEGIEVPNVTPTALQEIYSKHGKQENRGLD